MRNLRREALEDTPKPNELLDDQKLFSVSNAFNLNPRKFGEGEKLKNYRTIDNNNKDDSPLRFAGANILKTENVG